MQIIERLFRYDHWANEEEGAHLRNAPAVPDGARRIFAHIIGTQWVWLSRLKGEKPRMAVWPELSIEQAIAELPLLHRHWRAFLSVPHADTIHYPNSKGEQWSSRVEDVLLHVCLHGGYHRGQIATLLRQGGAEPAYTDYIHCTRTGAIESPSATTAQNFQNGVHDG